MINKFIHWLSHRLGNNTGKVVTWMEDGKIMVGFECAGCKIIDPATIVCCNIKQESEVNYE